MGNIVLLDELTIPGSLHLDLLKSASSYYSIYYGIFKYYEQSSDPFLRTVLIKYGLDYEYNQFYSSYTYLDLSVPNDYGNGFLEESDFLKLINKDIYKLGIIDWIIARVETFADRTIYQKLKEILDFRYYVDPFLSTLDRLAEKFNDIEVVPSSLQGNKEEIRNHKSFFPMMPGAFKNFELEKCDVVLTSSSSCAKMVKVPEGAIHIVYCHTPMRYAWSAYKEYVKSVSLLKRPLVRILLHILKVEKQFTLMPSDIEIKITRSKRDNMLTKAQTMQLLMQSGIEPTRAIKTVGLFSDPEQVAKESQERLAVVYPNKPQTQETQSNATTTSVTNVVDNISNV